MGGIFVYVEFHKGKARKTSLEALAAARGIAPSLNQEITAVVLGQGIEDAQAAALGKYGAAKILKGEDPLLQNYCGEVYAKVLAEKIKEAAAIFFSATTVGKDLAPRVAALLDSGLASDCTELEAADGKIRARRPVYAGKAYVTVEAAEGPFMATLRPNSFPAEKSGEPGQVESFQPEVNEQDAKTLLQEFIASEGAPLDVAEAPIVVSGGRGLKDPDHWNLIEDLAKALGAATGASRAVVDAGWRPHSEQVGQTGKTVAPVLYVACGISGAIQHLAGMRTSKFIVAINKDPEAPIFKVADWGIVGDVFEVLPALSKAIEAEKAQSQ